MRMHALISADELIDLASVLPEQAQRCVYIMSEMIECNWEDRMDHLWETENNE